MSGPRNLPDSWVECTLGEVVDYGATEKAEPSEISEDAWVLELEDVESNTSRVLQRLTFAERRSKSTKNRFRAGDVLYGKLRPYLNKVVRADRPGVCTTEIIPIAPPEGVEAAYVFHWLKHPSFLSYVSSVSHGLNMPRLGTEAGKQAPFVLAPTTEQKRIVAKIEELTARSRRAKEALDAGTPLLDQLRQSILASAFRGDLTADWRAKNPNVEPADTLVDRMRAERRARWESAEFAKLVGKGKRPTDGRWKDKYVEPAPPDISALQQLPESWCWTVLDAVATVVGGITKGQKRGADDELREVPYLRVANVQRGHLDLDEIKTILATSEEIEQLRLFPGDVLLNEGGDRDKLGRGWVWSGEVQECIHQNHVFRARPLQGSLHSKLISWFGNTFGQEFFIDEGKQTTNLASVSLTKVKRLPLPLMPAAEQVELVALLERHLAAIDRLEASLREAAARLVELDRSILVQAFRGELVPQDPNDEPASVLLERLRSQAASVSTQSRSRRGDESDREHDDDQEKDDREHGHRTRSIKIGSATIEAIDDGQAPGAPLYDDWLQPARRKQAEATFGPPAVLETLEEDEVHHTVFAALWPLGPMDKDAAVRRVAEYLRDAGNITYRRLRSDGDMYAAVLACVEGAVKAGYLDRPKRGQVRACKADATQYTADDWRTALVNSLGTEPVDRDEAIRAAAEWARDYMGLEFARLRSDGHIVEGLRSAINSGIRRGAIVRHDAKRISRAEEGESRESELAGSDDEDSISTEPEVADALAEEELDQKPTIERSDEPLVLDGSETVLVLQMGELDAYRALRLVVPAIDGALRLEGLPKDDAHWRFFLGFDQFHVEGLSTWLGLSKSLPSRVVDLIQRLIEVTGQRVRREYAPVAPHHLEPFLAATSSGLETPIRGALVLDRAQLEELHVPRVTRRPFVVDTRRAQASQQLLNLLLGPDPVE